MVGLSLREDVRCGLWSRVGMREDLGWRIRFEKWSEGVEMRCGWCGQGFGEL